jgi:acetyltransferase-like isoleucine patch superfamily enzyme
MGSSVIEELVVGDGSVIAAGAVVIKDVPDRVLMTGIPAKVKKHYDK